MRNANKRSSFVDVQLIIAAVAFWIAVLAVSFGTIWIMLQPPEKSMFSWLLLMTVLLCEFLIGPLWSPYKSLFQRVIFTEYGITVKFFGKTIGMLNYKDVKEFGIKWRMDSERFSMSRDTTKAYYVYFSNKKLSVEERALIGSVLQDKLNVNSTIFCADLRSKPFDQSCIEQILTPTLHASPIIEPIITMHFPVFSSVCERFAYDELMHTDIDCVNWTADEGIRVFTKDNRPAFVQKLFKYYDFRSIALVVVFLLLCLVVLLSV